MADAKISALPAATSLNDADELVVVQSGTTKKVQAVNLLSAGVVDNTTIEINGSSKLAVKDDGITTAKIIADAVTLAKMHQSAMAHVIGFLPAAANNGAATGSDVEVLDVVVSQSLMSTAGCMIKARAFFNILNDATGKGKIKIYDTDESLLATIETEEMDIGAGNDYQTGMIELEIYNNDVNNLAYYYKSWVINDTDSPVITMTTFAGTIGVLLDSVASDEWHLKFYVNCNGASDLQMTYATVIFYPYMNNG